MNIKHVDLWYPGTNTPETVDVIEIELMHVRAAMPIRVQYDFERDGYAILQRMSDEDIDDDDNVWRVVGFVGAWAADGDDPVLVEKLAVLAHEQWSGWMSYMFNKADLNSDGTWTMPKWAVERWQRQITTKYEDLSVEEQESDRVEARRVLRVLQENV